MPQTRYFLPVLFTLLFAGIALSQGDFWVPATALPTMNVTCLAFDQAGRLFAGTSDSYIFLSTDEGSTWTQVKTGMKDTIVMALAAGSGGYLYAGTSGTDGMYRSTDAGAHWAKVIVDTTSNRSRVGAFCIDANGQLLAASGGALGISTDNGAHWDLINIGGGGGGFGRGGISSIASNSSGLLFGGTGSGIFRSTDHGQSWENKSNGLQDSSVLSVCVDQNDYVFVGTNGGGVYGSQDYGQSWSRIDSGFINAYIHTIAVNSVGDVYVGTEGGGVYRSRDEGDTWEALSTGLTNFNIQSFAFDSLGTGFVATLGSGVSRSAHSTTPVKASPVELPREARLDQNYPNPFNPSTVIRYQLPDRRTVSLKVYSLLGTELATLVDGIQDAGDKSIVWNASGMPSGIYFCKLIAGDRSEVRKMTLLR